MSGAGDNPPDDEPSARFDSPRLEAGYIFRVLIADLAGFSPTVTAALKIQRYAELDWPQLVLIGAHDTFPFRPRPSTILVPGMPDGVIACEPEFDKHGIASRLASTAGLPGCYDGPVSELAELWLKTLDPALLGQTDILVSGTEETVRAAEDLGQRLGRPVHVI